MAGFDNTSGVASGGVPYQPAYTIQPKYGFRYSTQPFVDPYQDTYNPKYTAPPQKQIIPPNSTVPIIENNDSNNNDVANANQSAVTQMSIDAAQAANTRDTVLCQELLDRLFQRVDTGVLVLLVV